MLRIIRPNGSLAYPAGCAPGFNPGHVASRGCQFSAVVVAGSGFNLIRPAKATNVGISTGIDSVVGPYVQGDGTSSTYVAFPSGTIQGTNLLNGITFGLIVSFVSVSTQQYFVAAGSYGGNAWSMRMTNTGVVQAVGDNGGFVSYSASTMPVVAGRSYFIAAAITPGVGCDFIIRDLASGEVKTQAVTSATAGPTSVSTFASIGQGFVNRLSGSRVACATFGERILSPSELRVWADDPWSFWYPHRAFSRLGASAAFKAYWASNSNLPVLGTGIH